MNYNHLLSAQDAARAAFGYDETLEAQSVVERKPTFAQKLINRLSSHKS